MKKSNHFKEFQQKLLSADLKPNQYFAKSEKVTIFYGDGAKIALQKLEEDVIPDALTSLGAVVTCGEIVSEDGWTISVLIEIDFPERVAKIYGRGMKPKFDGWHYAQGKLSTAIHVDL